MPSTLPIPIHKTLDYHDAHVLNGINRQVFSITLSKQLTPTIMSWRCHNCGGVVFQYYNKPLAIFEGAINLNDCEMPTDHLCKRCNIIFRIT